MKTRISENRFKTSDITRMRGMYLASRLVRSWTEDFVDEDNGEVVTIERKEVIMERGTLLTGDKLQEVDFFLKSGDVEEVEVSDVQRESMRVFKNTTLWTVTVELNGKGKTVYLYADTLERAIDIATDYLEQTQAGTFSIKAVKRLEYSNILTDESEDENADVTNDGKEIKTYKVEVEQTEIEDGYTHKNEFILKATDVENAKKIIIDFITKLKVKQDVKPNFEIVVISAKTIPCDYIIGVEFFNEYTKDVN